MREVKMIKAIFFDFDLTLVNSRPGAKATYKALWKAAGLKISSKGFREYVGSRFSDMVDMLHKEADIPKKKIIAMFRKVYFSKIPKMRFYGKKLLPKIEGKKKMIILTNNDRKSVEEVCRFLDIHYDYLVADQDMKKGEKKHDAIRKMLKKLKLKKSEALYVGDHINDVKEAHKAGIMSVVVPTGVFKKLYIKRFHPDFMVSKIDKIADLI